MKPTAAAVVAGLSGLVILFGLLYTLYKGTVVAPEAHAAADGRLHHHLKNVTRFGGTVEQVRQAVHRAVFLTDTLPSPPGDWRESVRQQIQVQQPVRHIVALPSEGKEALIWSLPGAYWAVYAGVPVLFLNRSQLDQDASALIRQFNVPVYVLAPESLISEPVLRAIAELAPVKRLAGNDPIRHAVTLAEYRSEDHGFGWGRSGDRTDGYFQYLVTAPSDAEHAVAALPLARSNATTFLFFGDDGGIPAVTDRYLWSQRASFFVTPAEGPFRHLWIIGNRPAYAAQARADLSIEKSPYATLGSVAFGPIESLGLVFIALGIAGGIFVWMHGVRLLPEVMVPMRIAWTGTATLFPVGGLLLYLAAYRRKREMRGHIAVWWRPPSIVAASATAMSFGYGAPLMVAIGYLFLFIGFPLFFPPWAKGWLFLVGAGMPIMMVGMYLGAVLIAWPFVQMGMKSMWTGEPPHRVVWSALGSTALSMAAVSVGMMTVTWWMMMAKLPMMPKEDDLMWFASLWLASTLGFLIAWPLNWIMVRHQMKPGVT